MRILKGARYVAYARLYNRFWDAVTVLAGGCNARPERGGYAHWRCMRKRGHILLTPHRMSNYIWAEEGRPQYNPIQPDGNILAGGKTIQAWENFGRVEWPYKRLVSKRKMIRTRRAERQMRRAGEELLAQLEAERQNFC